MIDTGLVILFLFETVQIDVQQLVVSTYLVAGLNPFKAALRSAGKVSIIVSEKVPGHKIILGNNDIGNKENG